MVVYIDVLFVINLIVNYFILLSVAQLEKRKGGRPRIFAGAALGALYACLMFFPQLAFLYTALLKLALSVTIVAVAFKLHGVRDLLRLVLYFYLISMLFGGAVYAVDLFLAPPLLAVKNGVAYVDVSPVFLILSGAGCYVVISLVSRLFSHGAPAGELYPVTITVGASSASLTAMLDTGNDLYDAISGVPVVIAEYRRVEQLIPEKLRCAFSKGGVPETPLMGGTGFELRFRVVPYSSVGGDGGILPAFRPDRLTVAGKVDTPDVLLAVTAKRLSRDGSFTALLGPALFASQAVCAKKDGAQSKRAEANGDGVRNGS